MTNYVNTYSNTARKWQDLSVGIEIDFAVVWAVLIDVISVGADRSYLDFIVGIVIGLILCRGRIWLG